jgi:hypothetical protein
MTVYKRNQIEEAIPKVFEITSEQRAKDFHTRIKRLLDLDRGLGRKPRSKSSEQANFAFYSAEARGTGADVLFSEYEAFALLTGLRMMEHGWPQGLAVSLLRRVRGDLEPEHARILRQPPGRLFNQNVISANARPGDVAVSNTDPVFLAVLTKPNRTPDESKGLPRLCRGFQEALNFSFQMGAWSMTTFELATPAHRLRYELKKTQPRHRGRGAVYRSD